MKILIAVIVLVLNGCAGTAPPYYYYENKYEYIDFSRICLGDVLSKSDYSVGFSSQDSDFDFNFYTSLHKIAKEDGIIQGKNRISYKWSNAITEDDVFTSDYSIEFFLEENKDEPTENMAKIWNAASLTLYPGWYYRDYRLTIKLKHNGLMLREYQYTKKILVVHQILTGARNVFDHNYTKQVGEDFFDELLFDFLSDFQSDIPLLTKTK